MGDELSVKPTALTLDELIALLLQYHPQGIYPDDDRAAWDATPEIRRLMARSDACYADQATWLASVEELRTVVPSSVWDRTIPNSSCYEGRVHGSIDPSRTHVVDVVVIVSYLAPFYYIYGSDWLEGRGSIVTYGDDVPFPEIKRRIAEIVERRFGFAPLPEAWRDVEVPGVLCTGLGMAGTTVIDLLFTSDRQ